MQTGFGVLLGVLAPLAAALALWSLAARVTRDWRTSLAWAAVGTGLLVAVGTEALGVLGALSFWPVLGLYLGVTLLSWPVGRRLAVAGRSVPPLPTSRLRDPWVIGAGLFSLTILLIAIVSPPNNWDSMTYHMPRVMHWAASGDVSYYATHIDRQLFLQPWSEYAILHTYLLSGSDVWANSVQWAAMVVTVTTASLIAKNLGLPWTGQLGTALVVLTLPMGITQAATTQNDYVATMWVTICAALITSDRFAGRWAEALLLGSAVGLAGMTKATTYFFLLPLLGMWAWRRLASRRSAAVKWALVTAVVALVITAPGFLRNVDTFDSPTGPPLPEFVNDPVSPRATAENVVRHAGQQLGVPIGEVNATVAGGIRTSAAQLGLDVDRAGSTFPPGLRFTVDFGYREDNAQATIAAALLVVSLPILLLHRRHRRSPYRRPLITLVLVAAAGGLLLDSYFRWNPWNARYLMPFFVLTAPVSGAVVAGLSKRWRRAAFAVVLAAGVPWVLNSDLRPLVGSDSILTASRTETLYAAKPDLQRPYERATDFVRQLGIDRVGYIAAGDDWEYPLWVLLSQGDRDVVLQHVNVEGASRRYEARMPDAVICTRTCDSPTETGRWQRRPFGPVTVWHRT